MTDQPQSNLIELTVDLLAAFVSNNTVGARDIPGLIATTHAALSNLGNGPDSGARAEASAAQDHKPTVSIRKSLGKPDHILSMIDGKPYKTLKRHIARHGMTPAEYRARYNLPSDYPMVAPAYSEQRREVAKRLGLGQKLAAARKRRARSG